MWAPNRAKPAAHRTPSIHSIASIQSASRPVSMHSPQLQQQQTNYDSDNYSELGSDDEQTFPPRTNTAPLSWSRPQTGSPAANLMAKKMESQVVAPQAANVQYQNQSTLQPRPIDDDATSRASTLDGQEEEDTYSLKKSASQSAIKMSLTGQEPVSPAPAPHVPGPLESQLAALMSKLIHIEQANPAASVTPEEFTEMKTRLKALEDEKKVWWKRHEAIWSLRDEDVENNIKIRGMLAKARRELEETRALRDEDLENVQIVRSKLAEKTRELERLQAQGPTGGRTSPNRPRISSFYERRDTTDLFTAAKVAALEQRALELEKRNSDLVAQLGTAQSGSIDDLNRATAHQAWKGTVADLEAKLKAKDAQIQQLRSGASGGGAASAPGQMDWYRIEALLEEHANYRESIGGRLQALRSEKEVLMKDLHRKENECQALELKVQMLQRRANVL